MLPLPISPAIFASDVLSPALALLPKALDSRAARVLVTAICLQESGLATRRQYGDGPARGLAQFELGSKLSHGGVWGVYLHRASSELLRLLCRDRDCNFDPFAIWAQLEHDDVLAAGVARLMLLTNPAPLPDVGQEQGAWDYYVNTWRPGKPRPQDWPGNYSKALTVMV